MEVIDNLKIKSIYYENNNLIIIINDQKYSWSLGDISDKLLSASEGERNNFIISPSGYGIHWPGIDEDLSIQGLLNQKKHGA
jgi:hypothetical protein